MYSNKRRQYKTGLTFWRKHIKYLHEKRNRVLKYLIEAQYEMEKLNIIFKK
jgi:hypothetical protein